MSAIVQPLNDPTGVDLSVAVQLTSPDGELDIVTVCNDWLRLYRVVSTFEEELQEPSEASINREAAADAALDDEQVGNRSAAELMADVVWPRCPVRACRPDGAKEPCIGLRDECVWPHNRPR